jgi:hypothetical protein
MTNINRLEWLLIVMMIIMCIDICADVELKQRAENFIEKCK